MIAFAPWRDILVSAPDLRMDLGITKKSVSLHKILDLTVVYCTLEKTQATSIVRAGVH